MSDDYHRDDYHRDNPSDSDGTARILPVTCDQCGGGPVHALRRADRVVICCERCGAHIFAYSVDPARRMEASGSNRDQEAAMLAQVGEQTRALYHYIRRYITQNGYAPAISEMGAALGLSSSSSVAYHLRRLVEVGLIERDYAVPRGIRLIKKAA